jgi:hypothetical protein
MLGDHISMFLHLQLLLFVMRPQLALVPLLLVLTHVPISQANIQFMGDLASSFTMVVLKAFVFHAFHRLHEALTSVRDVHPLVEDLSDLWFQSMKEGQLLGKLSIKRDDN